MATITVNAVIERADMSPSDDVMHLLGPDPAANRAAIEADHAYRTALVNREHPIVLARLNTHLLRTTSILRRKLQAHG